MCQNMDQFCDVSRVFIGLEQPGSVFAEPGIGGGIETVAAVQYDWNLPLMDPPGYNLLLSPALLAAECKAIVQNVIFLEVWFFIVFGW